MTSKSHVKPALHERFRRARKAASPESRDHWQRVRGPAALLLGFPLTIAALSLSLGSGPAAAGRNGEQISVGGASLPVGFPREKWDVYQNIYNGLCIDASGGGTGNGTPVQQYTCNGTNAQIWDTNSDTSIGSRNNVQAVWNVSGALHNNGDKIILYQDQNTANEKWIMTDGSNVGVWQIQSLNTQTKCLDDPYSSQQPGVQLWQWDCNHTYAQQWSIVPLYNIVNQASRKCVDLRNDNTTDGNAVQQYSCVHNVQAQVWGIQRVPGTTRYKISSLKYLNAAWEVAGGSYSSQAKIIISHYHGQPYEQWYIEPLGNGFYRFVAVHSGMCLDVPGRSLSDGVQLWQYPCSANNPAQAFSVVPALAS